jgi:hypothetical protein
MKHLVEQDAWEDIWSAYVLMSRSRSREGGIGHGALTLDTHLDPWVGVRA